MSGFTHEEFYMIRHELTLIQASVEGWENVTDYLFLEMDNSVNGNTDYYLNFTSEAVQVNIYKRTNNNVEFLMFCEASGKMTCGFMYTHHHVNASTIWETVGKWT